MADTSTAAAFDIDASFYDQNLLPLDVPFPFDDGLDLDLDVDFDDFDIDAFLHPQPTDGDHPSLPPLQEGSSSGVFSTSSSPAVSTNRTSPDSPNTSAASVVADLETKLEEDRIAQQGIKRKKGYTDRIANANPNPSKLQRAEDVNSPVFSAGSDEDEKRKARLIRNRESAQLSRQRKKHYIEELEDKVKAMHSTITELNSKISYFMAENASLRQQLGGGGGPPLPSSAAATVVYPPPPMHFPWVPGYVYRHPHGTSVPLVPIPRLKPQHPTPAPKNRKSESKKGESKTKKVASVSLLGLFLIMLVFGAVFPGLNYNYRGKIDSVTGRPGVVRDGMFGYPQGRVLTVSGRAGGLNSTDEMGLHSGSRVKDKPAPDVPLNTSESIPALLYVPRNGKHVKINGNLIIHSVLASEKATAEKTLRDNAKQSPGKGTGLAVAGNVGSSLAISQAGNEVARHPKSYRSSNEHQKEANGDTLRSTPADGPLQQWFREGLAGPILNSGMCTEVFQFEVSPAANPGGIVPVTSVVNATAETPRKSASQEKMRNRRILYGQTLPIAGSILNDTERVGKSSSDNGSFHGNTPVSSMVVSVLADPREAGDGDGDGMMSPKSLSRIFVVVLLDSIKYVTYSCVLPFKSSSPHLVD